MGACGLKRIGLKSWADVPSSPFCPRCLIFGELHHTFKIAGKPAFKCGTCKATHPGSKFSPIDFTWKEDFEGWKASKLGHLNIEKGNMKMELERLDKICK